VPNEEKVDEIETYPLFRSHPLSPRWALVCSPGHCHQGIPSQYLFILVNPLRKELGDKIISIAVPGRKQDLIAYTKEQGPKIWKC
jgi:chitinase